ncbi:double-stranded RNA-binding protein 1-like isoform X2 [Pistacia vera]|uniref:double-stranded RNA-binding protein 1-like isoform X2 n=1 Tax=Pistacia vera TaxID=55513 RepID=UPI001263A6E7|nr:double-stranded RNA-binding protein 1-like isoform X2 [Pistacia vera]
MYKSRLQELCHQRSFNLPEYTSTKQGPDHNPRFQATVTVNDILFTTPNLCRSSKEAQNTAARLAFEHFSSSQPAVSSSSDQSPQVSATTSVVKDDYRFRGQTPQVDAATSSGKDVFGSRDETALFNANSLVVKDVCRSRGSASASTLQMNIQQTDQTPQVSAATSVIKDDNRLRGQTPQVNAATLIGNDVYGSRDQTPLVNATSSVVKDVCRSRDTLHLYKNQLQSYAQKRNLAFPIYSCEREGPPHASCFKCKVTVGGQSYECQEFFPTLKEAEHGAAKVALMSLSSDGVQEDESGFYKNLLQELAQKEGYALPVYHTNRTGEAHAPTFVSTVEVEAEVFTGQEAKTKKQAEMSAAKVAYLTLKERKPTQRPTVLSAAIQAQADYKYSSLQSNLTNDVHHKNQPTGHVVLNQSSVEAEEGRVNGDVSSQHLIDAFPQPVIDPNWKRESSPSFPSAPSTPDNTPPSSSLHSDSSANVVPESSIGAGVGTHTSTDTSTGTRIRVCPSTPNMIFPRGSTLLRSDDKWVALKFGCQSNQ